MSARPSDFDLPVKQQTYWRALKTLPNLSIVEGSYLSHPLRMPLDPAQSGGRRNPVWVIKTEEKASDVNSATHLLNDAHKNDFDVAVMITNDSDLLEPMRIVKEELGLTVRIINPQKKPSFQLQAHASFIKSIRPWVLESCQFPETLSYLDGKFNKPKRW